MEFHEDKGFEHTTRGLVVRAVANHCGHPLDRYRIASRHLDEKEATDLITPFGHTALRVRRPKWGGNYHEFTIRWKRPNGIKTEYEKIIGGFGDALIYAILETDDSLRCWAVINLQVFRAWEQTTDPVIKKNTDSKGSQLSVWKYAGFPAPIRIVYWTNQMRSALSA